MEGTEVEKSGPKMKESGGTGLLSNDEGEGFLKGEN